MLVIGVVGGIASGKSVVARRLAAWGAVLLDADRVGHEVLEQAEVRAALRARWGERVFTPPGHVSRPAIAAIVFQAGATGAAELKYLESLTHPRIREQLEQQIAGLRAGGQVPAAVLDAPLLFEARWNTLCDRILFVEAPRAQRLERARRARGWTADEFARREAAQLALAEKRRGADHVIDNSADPQHTYQQVDQWWRDTCGLSSEAQPAAAREHVESFLSPIS